MNPVIIIAGHAAAGKTTLARRLASGLRFSFVDLGSVVRQTALDFLEVANSEDVTRQKLSDEVAIGTYLQTLKLVPVVDDNGSLEVEINRKRLNVEDPKLREAFLDDRTLVLARTMRPSLISLQREAAKLKPVVFSARNATAFSEDESVRIFINSGMTARVRRRARYEGDEYGNLPRVERRDLISRVVAKEKESIDLGVALSHQLINQEGFVVFENDGSIEQSMSELRELTVKLMTEKGWVLRSEKERISVASVSPERR
jgi:CMP/dCMP kinase